MMFVPFLSIVTSGVKKEPWYALLDNLVATSNIKQKRKGPRPFVTFVPNEKRELVQLTFDLSEFKKDHKSEVKTQRKKTDQDCTYEINRFNRITKPGLIIIVEELWALMPQLT